METGFGGGIGKCLEGGDAQTVDATDVDDAGGRCRGRGGFEEGRDGLGKLEDALQVEV